MKKSIIPVVASSLLLGASLEAFSLFSVDINQEIQQNKRLIERYEKSIIKLKEQNKYMLEEKEKNPQLYVKKPLYEELEDKYIYRIKLNGAKADALNFMVKDNIASVKMDMKKEEKNENGYFYSSQQFSSSYTIPKDVQQNKIEHKVEGDYFTIIMPKK
jgi:HSP20 family molecular chaperone IbpA